jgi:hypothetical protein
VAEAEELDKRVMLQPMVMVAMGFLVLYLDQQLLMLVAEALACTPPVVKEIIRAEVVAEVLVVGMAEQEHREPMLSVEAVAEEPTQIHLEETADRE